jgi:hypothetical protein
MALNLGHLDGTNGFRLDGANAGDYSAASVAGAGDINGDGIDDLIVGAPSSFFPRREAPAPAARRRPPRRGT